MMKSPLMKMLYTASLWLNSIAALHKGLEALNINLLPDLLTRLGLGMLTTPLFYVLGISGVIGLLGLIMYTMDSKG